MALVGRGDGSCVRSSVSLSLYNDWRKICCRFNAQNNHLTGANLIPLPPDVLFLPLQWSSYSPSSSWSSESFFLILTLPNILLSASSFFFRYSCYSSSAFSYSSLKIHFILPLLLLFLTLIRPFPLIFLSFPIFSLSSSFSSFSSRSSTSSSSFVSSYLSSFSSSSSSSFSSYFIVSWWCVETKR